MAITSELIGKLGGSDIQTLDISFPGKRGETVLGTATLASGATNLVVLIGTFAKSVASYTNVDIQIDGVAVGRPSSGSKYVSVAKVITSTSDIVLVNDSNSDNAFSGTLYLANLSKQ